MKVACQPHDRDALLAGLYDLPTQLIQGDHAILRLLGSSDLVCTARYEWLRAKWVLRVPTCKQCRIYFSGF